MSTPTATEVKIAGFIHNNLTNVVTKAATHPVFCKLNLHNNKFLKTLNKRAGILYKMATQEESVVKAPYTDCSDDNIENPLLSILDIVRNNRHFDHKEYLLKRIDFLASEALSNLYTRNYDESLQLIHAAIHSAKKPLKKTKTNKAVKRLRDKKGRFIGNNR